MSVRPWGEPGPGDGYGRGHGHRPPVGWQPASAVSAQAAMRAGHADRDRTVDVLKAAFAEGRLSAEEFEQRHEAVAAAQTYGQLAALVVDLPVGPMATPALAPLAPPVPVTFLPAPPPPQVRPTNVLAVVSLMCGLTGLSLPAVVTGHVARAQIRRDNSAGDSAAVLGLVIGYLGSAFWTLMLLLGLF
ncbi:DUF1707 and DUF4190 domain-containing protein [Streptomyces sp. NRRL S-350]|uniref:DUF1707 and DUF4190 domain-containing protein n=1 Tax=Streptomyces sp. NRRL S-350 TaxID=1463902 RepID=UPI000B0EAE74|nr:DUF1707 and DUF4190 domain-containing protein [Streptomyces sp. NRRL S-350]